MIGGENREEEAKCENCGSSINRGDDPPNEKHPELCRSCCSMRIEFERRMPE